MIKYTIQIKHGEMPQKGNSNTLMKNDAMKLYK